MIIIEDIKEIIAVILVIIIAIAAAFIAEYKDILTINQMIILFIFIIVIIALFSLLTYFLNINKLEKHDEYLDNINKKFDESLARLSNHIYHDEKIITFEEVSKLISESQEIWVFNPLKKIDYFEESIKKSIQSGCLRRFVVTESDKPYFELYKKHVEEELKINCDDFIKIISWNISDRPFVPISVVISRNEKNRKVWLHLSGLENLEKRYKYAFYFDDPEITFYFESWFMELWKKLTGEDIKCL